MLLTSQGDIYLHFDRISGRIKTASFLYLAKEPSIFNKSSDIIIINISINFEQLKEQLKKWREVCHGGSKETDILILE